MWMKEECGVHEFEYCQSESNPAECCGHGWCTDGLDNCRGDSHGRGCKGSYACCGTMRDIV